MRAEFEEKTFEVAANNELALLGVNHPCLQCGPVRGLRGIDLWAPGQVLEGVLGFDVLVEFTGDFPEIEPLLSTALPPGMYWKSHFGSPPAAASAPAWASLFIQYKRPEYLLRRRGRFLTLFTGPYFRFDLDPRQHSVLASLRTAALGQALVAYASPRFHTNADMIHYRQSRLVLERTAFIEARDDEVHDVGVYDETRAFLCSDPVEVPSHNLPGLLVTIRRMDLRFETSQSGLRAHVAGLAAAVRRATDRELESSVDDRLGAQVRSVLRFAAETQCVWLLATVTR